MTLTYLDVIHYLRHQASMREIAEIHKRTRTMVLEWVHHEDRYEQYFVDGEIFASIVPEEDKWFARIYVGQGIMRIQGVLCGSPADAMDAIRTARETLGIAQRPDPHHDLPTRTTLLLEQDP